MTGGEAGRVLPALAWVEKVCCGLVFSWVKGCAPALRSHDEGGSFAAGRARKSLSLSGRFRNSSMEKPAETDMLQDSVVRPITGFPARRTYC